MFQPVHRIEEALRLWERVSMGMRIISSIASVPGGPVPASFARFSYDSEMFHEAPGFRGDLLYAYTRDFPDDKYGHLDIGIDTKRALGGLATFPVSLWSWTRCSRRVWQISPALCTLLENTHLDDLAWGEVPWPLDSYGIVFSQPLIESSSGSAYDCAIISRALDGDTRLPVLICSLIKNDVARYAELPRNAEKLFVRSMRKRDTAGLARQLTTVYGYLADINRERPIRHIATHMLSQTANGDFVGNNREITRMLGMEEVVVDQEHAEFMARLLRIVVGLNMYMAHVVPREGGASEPTPPARVMDGSAITNKAQVCWVDVSLSGEELSNLESAGAPTVGKRVHWRKGHWRRLPRSESQVGPSPRTWIRPVLVNAHRLAEGSLPVGSHTGTQSK